MWHFVGEAAIKTHHGKISSMLHRLTSAVTAFALFATFSINPALAQSSTGIPVPVEPAIEPVGPSGVQQRRFTDIDIDPPVIDHEALKSGGAGKPQEFRAVVIDDKGLKRVWLFYREQSGAQYASVPMQQVGETSEYAVTLDSSPSQEKIEYYLEAVDTGGNRVLKGFPFFPLVRQLNPAKTSIAESEQGSDNTLLYVLLGVAAVGVGLALASGGSDDPPGPTEPEPGTVPLTIVVHPPTPSD